MNIDIARKVLTSPDTASSIKALEVLGQEGKLTDLQAMLAFTKATDPQLAGVAVMACGNLIRSNLIAHFHELDPQVR